MYNLKINWFEDRELLIYVMDFYIIVWHPVNVSPQLLKTPLVVLALYNYLRQTVLIIRVANCIYEKLLLGLSCDFKHIYI